MHIYLHMCLYIYTHTLASARCLVPKSTFQPPQTPFDPPVKSFRARLNTICDVKARASIEIGTRSSHQDA